MKRIPSGRLIVEFTRPFTLAMPALSFVAAAVIALGASPRPACDVRALVGVLGGAIAMALMTGGANALNQVFDVREDSVNKPFRPLPSGRLSQFGGAMIALALLSSSMLLAALTAPTTRGLFAAILVAVVAYSVPPARLKGRGWWANLTIALARGALLRLAGWSVLRDVMSVEAWWLGLTFMLFLTGAASTKDFSDLPGDARFDVRTLVVRLGGPRAIRAIAPFLSWPWLLLSVGAWTGVLTGSRPVLEVLGLGLCVWGRVVAVRVLPRTERSTDGNHPAWRQMYLMLMTADAGLVVAYGLRIAGF